VFGIKAKIGVNGMLTNRFAMMLQIIKAYLKAFTGRTGGPEGRNCLR
jgi:hypothetical protein